MVATVPNGGENAGGETGDTVKVIVFLYKFDDTYISTVRQALQDIQTENDGKGWIWILWWKRWQELLQLYKHKALIPMMAINLL